MHATSSSAGRPLRGSPSRAPQPLPRMVARDLSLHAAPMDRDFEERLRIDAQRVRRRSFAVLAGFAGFLASLCFSKDPDDTLQLAVALVFSCITVRLISDRWFGRDRSELFTQPLRTNGPGRRFAHNRRLRRPDETPLTHPCGKVRCSRCRQPGPVSLTLDSYASPVAAAPGCCGLGLPVRCPSTSKTSPAPGTDGDPTSAVR